MMFDDDTVSPIDEADIQKYYGESAAGSGYVLFYQAIDLDPTSIGLRMRETEAFGSLPTPIQPPPNLVPASYFPPVRTPSASPNIISSSNGYLDVDSRTPPLFPPPTRPPFLDVNSASTITPSPAPTSPIREHGFSPIQSNLNSPAQSPPRSPVMESFSQSELGRSLAAKRSPALPPSSMKPPSVGASSSLSRASSMASLPPSAVPLPSTSMSKEGGGGWFSRRAGGSKEKTERRISSSTSWYGGNVSSATAPSSSVPTANGSSASSTADLPRERSQTSTGSPLLREEDPRSRQLSASGHLEQSFRDPSPKSRLPGIVPRSRDASATIAEGVVDTTYSSSSSSSSNLLLQTKTTPRILQPLPPFTHSHTSPSLLFKGSNGSANPFPISTPPNQSPPIFPINSVPSSPLATPQPTHHVHNPFHVGSRKPEKETKEEKKERERAEKDAEKRKKLERKTSLGPGSSSGGGGFGAKLGGLGRSGSMAMKIGFGKKD